MIFIFLFTAAGPVLGGIGWFFQINALFWIGVLFCCVTLYMNGVSGAMRSPVAPIIFVIIGAMIVPEPWFYGAAIGLLVWTTIETVGNLIGLLKSKKPYV